MVIFFVGGKLKHIKRKSRFAQFEVEVQILIYQKANLI